MNAAEVIRKKRSGERLSQEEMEFLVNGYVRGTIPDYQMSAFLMAVYFRGMDFEETTRLTEIMLNSGKVVDLSTIPGIKVDKHSTGGVGDKISLILAPLVAACGVPVPMISGRGLGHTGGTLDKLESIPGFRTDLSLDEYRKQISEIGVVMIGQTDDLVPADRRMYALRDVTATVESIPLIAASIMSKKLAEGADALVFDVKTGQGAFMEKYDDAVELAKTLVTIGNKFGKRTLSLITDMSQPLGHAVGNWVEVVEAIECLQGRGPEDLVQLTCALAGAMLMLGGRSSTIKYGMDESKSALESGRAYKKFLELVSRQGGDLKCIENPDQYPYPKHSVDILSSGDGYVESINALEIGLACIELGAGRKKIRDKIDPNAGVVFKKKIGDPIQRGERVATIYADRREGISSAKSRIEGAIRYSASRPQARPLILSKIEIDAAKPENVIVRPWGG
ncbi:MAG: thymidine phosphorylase [Bacteroidota bacterium]